MRYALRLSFSLYDQKDNVILVMVFLTCYGTFAVVAPRAGSLRPPAYKN